MSERMVFLQKFMFMQLKISLLVIAIAVGPILCIGQTSDAEADAVINLLGVQKREAIAKMVPVTGKDSVSFWKIYDEYQAANKMTAKTRMRLYEGTVQAYPHMNAQVADSLAKRYFSNRLDQEKSLETYYQKIKAATNALVAFEFYQAEVYLLTQIRAQIMAQIPVYGSLVAPRKP